MEPGDCGRLSGGWCRGGRGVAPAALEPPLPWERGYSDVQRKNLSTGWVVFKAFRIYLNLASAVDRYQKLLCTVPLGVTVFPQWLELD